MIEPLHDYRIEPVEPKIARIRELRAVLALAEMYQQYCGGRFGHNYMGAGEDAAEVLGWYGLMKKDDEIDDLKVDEFERWILAYESTHSKK